MLNVLFRISSGIYSHLWPFRLVFTLPHLLLLSQIASDFSIAGTWLYGDGQPGWARWVIEEGTDKLVGATFCCVEGSEFVNASQVAVVQGLTLKEMVHVVPPFPTRGEIWTYLLNTAGF